jgi:hypothetical protein
MIPNQHLLLKVQALALLAIRDAVTTFHEEGGIQAELAGLGVFLDREPLDDGLPTREKQGRRPAEVWEDCVYSMAMWHRYEPTGVAAVRAMCLEFLERFPQIRLEGHDVDDDFDVEAIREFCDTILSKLANAVDAPPATAENGAECPF